ncbi:Uma2 family endonuclease [Phytoactinopolyspora halotolerans]|uniref:Uma2 family endonuclease n=1 Tax=Phytoactinopolyspora halotolerans TaxID=1981512 RepID=A0A6L9SBZ7_9ACTN|nr:Uma2 family endonuclease [Phytoactinopolyspora halotolerans]NEE02122.1 Uma2 family endonuclease [Phytoactinopolyspora halotolerans]
MALMPRASHDWTVDDLEQLPDDGLQYELLDGILLVTPAPIPLHQETVSELCVQLRRSCPRHLKALVAPLDWRPDTRTSLQPDLLVVARGDIGEQAIIRPPLLAVEVLSPSTGRKDRVLKFSKYAEAGVASYWIVDPARPSIDAYDLVDGAYVEAGSASGSDSVILQRPYPITITPAALVDI